MDLENLNNGLRIDTDVSVNDEKYDSVKADVESIPSDQLSGKDEVIHDSEQLITQVLSILFPIIHPTSRGT